jgi:hypothetical protein
MAWKRDQMLKKSCWLLLAFMLSCTFHPLRAQAAPGCEGSTVDAQGPETAKTARAFLAQLQAAVRANDKEKIADMISYPVNVNSAGKRTRIRTKEIFLARYDTVFNERIRKAILDQSSRCLFGNSNGEMIGNGEIWFDEINNGPVKIYAINLNTPSN